MVNTSLLPRIDHLPRRQHPSDRAMKLLAAKRGRLAAICHFVPSRRTVVVYAIVGLASNLSYLALFRSLQAVLAPLAANLVALILTTVGNTAAHRRYTFGIHGRSRLLIAHLGGFAGMTISLGASTVALTALDALDHQPSTLLASTTLWVATALAAWVRFGPLRHQIGRVAMCPDILTQPARPTRAATYPSSADPARR
jgi:putative flippase GtrA